MNPMEYVELLERLDAKHDMMSPGQLLEWVQAGPGEFTMADMSHDKYAQLRYLKMCEKMVEIKTLQRVGGRRGHYQPVDSDLIEMDFAGASGKPVDIWLPFEIHKLIEIFPGNILIVAGAKSGGKTALMLNTIAENEARFDEVHYFNSEMGAAELAKRRSFFFRQWKSRAYERSTDFGSVVKGGEGNLNIIDFLEVHGGAGDEFWNIGGKIREIHDNLNGAICIICIQKNPGLDLPLGGARAIEKARLVLTLDKGRVKIYDAKNWRDPKFNPNGLSLDFKLAQGTRITYRRSDKDLPAWYTEEKNEHHRTKDQR